jgi:hypothetical protein
MDLISFMRLVDESSSVEPGAHGYDWVVARIRSCFTFAESDHARHDAGQIIDDLGLRYLCEGATVDPYLRVADLIRQCLRLPGDSAGSESNWPQAVALALAYSTQSTVNSPDQAWISNTRVNCLAVAINELRRLGYDIRLPSGGGVDVSAIEWSRIAQSIDRKAASLGYTLALSLSGALGARFSSVTGRFRLGRNGKTLELNAKPPVPFAYLYQLGLRYFALPVTAPFPDSTLAQLVDLVTWSVALLDISVSSFELMFARHRDMIPIMSKSVMYDAVFLVAQVKPAHAIRYLNWMMTRASLAHLKDGRGNTAAQILAAATTLLRSSHRACEKKLAHQMFPVSLQDISYATNLDREAAAALLHDIFAHTSGANQTLSFPPRDNDIDAAFRPLLVKDGQLYMQPAPMAARALVNAALQWCRDQWRKKDFDDKVLGPLFEEFVRATLMERGVCLSHGDYTTGQSEGEFDAVVENDASVIVVELKSKMLRRQSRSGDDVAAMADLAQALVRPQAQAMERHAVLRENEYITLANGGKPIKLSLRDREVLRLSITRGDLGSLHDRPFLQLFLRIGCVTEFTAVDVRRQKEFDQLHEWFGKLRAASRRVGEPVLETRTPFSTSWSLSIFQLLLLLDRTSDNESFAMELQKTRRMITPLRDFYSEYEYMLELEQYKVR